MDQNPFQGIVANDLGSLLSFFEEAQTWLEQGVSENTRNLLGNSLDIIEEYEECADDKIDGSIVNGNVLCPDVDYNLDSKYGERCEHTVASGNSDTSILPAKGLPDNSMMNDCDTNKVEEGTTSDTSSSDDSSDFSTSDKYLSNNEYFKSQNEFSGCLYRGRGSNFVRCKKGGCTGGLPGRGRSHGLILNTEDQSSGDSNSGQPQYYDKLPNYYTALSRPIHGIVRNIRINPSELEFPEDDKLPSYESPVLNKVPAYQSCFTNSTKYDEKFNDMKFSLRPDEEVRGVVYRKHYRAQRRDWCRRAKHRQKSFCEKKSRFRERPGSKSRSVSRGRSLSRGRSASGGRSASRGRSVSRGKSVSKGRSRSRGRSRARRKTFMKRGKRFPESTSRHNEGIIHGQDECSDDGDKNMLKKKTLKKKSLERKIVYIGRISSGCTREELVDKFRRFGKITECSVHFRGSGDNYGFVTYEDTDGASGLVKNGGKLPGCADLDICFGGRRIFCKADYTDLDGNKQVTEEYAPGVARDPQSFDELLRDAIRSRR